jgi:hypothetical protein
LPRSREGGFELIRIVRLNGEKAPCDAARRSLMLLKLALAPLTSKMVLAVVAITAVVLRAWTVIVVPSMRMT